MFSGLNSEYWIILYRRKLLQLPSRFLARPSLVSYVFSVSNVNISLEASNLLSSDVAKTAWPDVLPDYIILYSCSTYSETRASLSPNCGPFQVLCLNNFLARHWMYHSSRMLSARFLEVLRSQLMLRICRPETHSASCSACFVAEPSGTRSSSISDNANGRP